MVDKTLPIGDNVSTMKIKNLLLNKTALAIKNGASVFSLSDIATLLQMPDRKAAAKVMYSACSAGLFTAVAKGLYISSLHSIDQLTILYKIANRLRAGSISYISLESELSHTGAISQIPIDRVTIITTGRKGLFKTPFGTIEFTHTKRSPVEISKSVYFDSRIQMFRANAKQALLDLKKTGRNTHMLEVDNDGE